MADVTKSVCVTNGSADIVESNAAASQTFDVGKDEKFRILIDNGGATTLSATISKGTGIASVMGDLAVSVDPETKKIIGPLESARFKNMSTGKVTMTLGATASITVAAIE